MLRSARNPAATNSLRGHAFALLPRLAIFSCLVLHLASRVAAAQTYTDLHDFDCTVEGCAPSYPAVMAQGRDGNLYGTTNAGGSAGMGTVFKLTPAGAFTTIYNFSGPDGQNPDSGLTLGPDGNFYGTTERGGSNNFGTIFKITSAGILTTLHTFANLGDAYTPHGAPVLGRNGELYGTTCSQNPPWIFYSITPLGVFHQLGSVPGCPFGSLILGADGNFYGTSQVGGTLGDGTVFRITPAGVLTIVHSFDYTDGAYLYSPVVQGGDGLLYGTTSGGGQGPGVIFRVNPNTGAFSDLHEWTSTDLNDGKSPYAGLVAASDGNFYGATTLGANTGNASNGTLFKIKSGGTYSIEHVFDYNDGSDEIATPMQHTNGKIYGLADRGGAHTDGVIYSLDEGIKPFIRLASPDAAVGKTIQIVGTGLKTATSVTFGAVPATFTAISQTYLSAVVPANATAGFIMVTTPTATYTSNRKFQVVPTLTNISPTSGPVGSQVTITGTGLLGATQVVFGGVQATSFTVSSATSITATVPAGAATGKIVVKEPGTSGASAAAFTVTP